MEQHIPLVDLKAQFKPLKAEIFKAWEEVMESMNLFLGPNVQTLEKNFAEYCGVSHAIGVCDGTKAVLLALKAVGVEPGDEVITVSHTFIATVEAIMLIGATPVFVDVHADTCLMDVSQVEEKITPKTKAIVPVHLYGQCVDMDPLLDIASRHHLFVIEDACQAHGAEYKERKAGSLGDLGAFSFYFTKNLGAYGEGGIVTTKDPELARRVRMLRDHGSEKRYYHDMIGWNARLDELQAAALRIKLPYLDQWNDQRRELADLYREKLANVDIILPEEIHYNRHVYHLFVIRMKNRDGLRTWLNGKGIGTGIHYPVPAHLQKACADLGYPAGSLPVTEQVTQEILSLPMYADLTPGQVETVVAAIHEFIISEAIA
jgi:dTDP-4-amino-4,6-dideoxygalactose transaminase